MTSFLHATRPTEILWEAAPTAGGVAYLAEQRGEPLAGVVVVRVDPDEAYEVEDVSQLGGHLAGLQLGHLLARLPQQGHEGQVGLGLERAVLEEGHSTHTCHHG